MTTCDLDNDTNGTCIHEAGHFVCYWALGFDAPKRVIIYDAKTASKKHVFGTVERVINIRAILEGIVSKEERISTAGGYAAQSIYGGEDAEDRSLSLLTQFGVLFASPNPADDMSRLIESSRYKRKKSIFKDCFECLEIAVAVLKANWDKVLEVANLLAAKSKLNGRQCAAIYRQWGRPQTLRKVVTMARIRQDARREADYYADMGML